MKKLLLILTFVLTAVNPFPAFGQTYVSEDDIAAALKKEYLERFGEGDEIELEFYGGQTNFSLEEAGEVKIMVANARFDELQNKFSADVEVFAGGKPVAKSSYQGKYYILTEVFVPAQNINKGEVITADKLKSVKTRSNRVKPQHLADKDKLINMEAKRNLREGKMISDKDVGKIVLIKKGSIVNLIYQTPYMQITAKAEALEDGCRGDRIEIRNTKSKKDLYGEVVDAETVRIEQQ
ncbi:MAG: flagellar basal body P-ring formation protein FlgA [Alphaproteobacteria bacterium]|nr:flagellar basal body P-ring formation protein FlgA [Alphaproteobacteria bacterium]MBQ8630298.1 flagellar basal body P-ring formation protein FlgA [Alphaproteobacteria bacterium]